MVARGAPAGLSSFRVPSPHCVAVGCSGGPDSLSLTLWAHRAARVRGGTILALIVEHGLRPESRPQAEALAKALRRRGITARILALGLAPGPGLQERARAARRAALLAACAEAGALHLLLGHHAEDQAETIAFRALRGSGPRGLAGMAATTVAAEALVLRPMLGMRRAVVARNLAGCDIEPLQDPSNADARFARARLRGVGGVDGAGLAAPAFARRRARLAGEDAARLARSVKLLPEGCARIDVDALGQDAVARRVMGALVRAIGGGGHAPTEAAVARLLARGVGIPASGTPAPGTSGSNTLGGARWLRGGGWLVREAATGGWRDGIWDGRFRAAAPPEGFTLAALGADVPRFRVRARHLPAAALAALPALRRTRDGMLALVPHLAYDAMGMHLDYPISFAPLGGPVTEFGDAKAFPWPALTPCSLHAGEMPGEGECDT